MKKHRVLLGCIILIVLAAAGAVLVRSQVVMTATGAAVIAGRNVNMVAGTKLPWGDPWLQRQNEPSITVSSRNPLHLFAGANDYRTIDMPDLANQKVPGLPVQIAAARDAWLGIFKSFDGGQSWITSLVPGYPQDVSADGIASPIHGYDTACDPCVRAGANGLFFMSGIAFNRSRTGGAVFVARFMDNNNLEKVQHDGYGRPSRDSIEYVDTKAVSAGNAGLFLDMPSLAVDIPRTGLGTSVIEGQTVPNARVYLAYTVFPGSTAKNVRSKLYLARSTNSGRTWSMPIKVSESQQIIQRAVIAVDPHDATGKTVYIAYRRFLLDLIPDAIVVVKSVDGGATFSKPVVISTLPNPFDQLMNENRFRTNTYPTIAVDQNGIVYVAWAERRTQDGVRSAGGQARIVMATSANGLVWSTPQVVELQDESGVLDGHQVMPALSYAGGRLMLVWYDQRGTIAKEVDPGAAVSEYYEDSPGIFRQTVDVRAAEIGPGLSPVFNSSIQVSRYLFYLVLGADGEPEVDAAGFYTLVQAEYNPINYPMFQTGTRPFHGDFLDLAASPSILPPPLVNGTAWGLNTNGALHPTSFHAAWTDNRDVRPPYPNWWGDWSNYYPPNSVQPPGSPFPQDFPCQGSNTAGMRNQNIYTASLSDGLQVGSPGNTKPLNIEGGTPGGRRTFVIFLRDLKGQELPTDLPRSFALSFDGTVPGHASASFKQDGTQPERGVTLGFYSSASITVYVDEDSDALAPVKVDIRELPGNALAGYVLLNPDPTNLAVKKPDDPSSDLGDEKHTPRVSDPKVWKYDAGGEDPHPGAENPRVQNPRVQNSGLVNPRVQNQGVQNPRVQNKTLTNENIVNSETGNPRVQNPRVQNTALTDMTWTVTNDGNTTSGFEFDAVTNSGTLDGYFAAGTLYGQLLVYKVHTTPIDQGCELQEEHHDELIINVTNPRVQNPRVQNIAPTMRAGATTQTEGAGDTEPDVTENDATFWLAPGEEAYVILRVYDPDTTDGIDFDPQMVAAEVAAEAVDTGATSADPVIVTQPSVPWVGGETMPVIAVKPTTFALRAAVGTAIPDRGFNVWNVGNINNGGTSVLDYTISVDAGWLSVTPAAGTSASEYVQNTHTIVFSTAGMTVGDYHALITVTDPKAANNPIRIPVSLYLYGTYPPPVNEWTARYTTGPNTEDTAGYLAVDAEGNVFVTGSVGPAGSRDIRVVKYDPYGAKIWEVNHNIHGGDDFPMAIAVDAEGSVYVTGAGASGPSGPLNYVTFKYTGLGVLVWTAEYDNPAADDIANSMAVDAAGNVYVTGVSHSGPGAFTDCATVKYSPTGVQLWAALRSGPSELGDTPTGLAVDAKGGVYVTGTGFSDEQCIQTIKYSSQGIQLWDQLYSPPAGAWAVGLALGPSGSVYVTGRVQTETVGLNYVTIKYDPAGQQAWWKWCDGPGHDDDVPAGIAVDNSENVAVTGATFKYVDDILTRDYLTVKYDTAGNVLWTQIYDGSGNGNDGANALAVDPSTGDIAVTGFSDTDVEMERVAFATVKYNAEGREVWVHRYDGFGTGRNDASSVAIDVVGNVYVAGRSPEADGTGMDFVTIKYRPTIVEWADTYNGSASLKDWAADVVTDGAGNVYATGASSEAGHGTDIITVKVDSAGQRLWAVLYNGPANGDDAGKSIALDPSGNVYVTGTSTQTGTGKDITTIKYTPGGTLSWARTYPRAGDDAVSGLGLDGAGHIIVSGTRGGPPPEIVTIQYDGGGTELWAKGYSVDSPGTVSSSDLSVTPVGDIFIVGTVQEGTAAFSSILTLKYDSLGTLGWARQHGADGNVMGRSIAVDAAEDVYVAGTLAAGGDVISTTSLLAKYDPAGNLQWGTSAANSGTAIALDAEGDVYLAGSYVTKFDKDDGAKVWNDSSSLGSTFTAFSVWVDASGNVYCGGMAYSLTDPTFQTDGALAKLDGSGHVLWQARYFHAGDDMGVAIAPCPDGGIVLVTTCSMSEDTGDLITIKFRNSGV